MAGSFLLCELVMWLVVGLPHPYSPERFARDLAVHDQLHAAAPNRYVPSYHTQVELEMEHDGEALPGVVGRSRFSIGPFGFRSPRLRDVAKGPAERRVFCIGGSTTECLYLDDDDAWPEVLQRELGGDAGLDVINAGHSGDTTRDHIALLSQRIVPFAPDVVIVLAGINDMFLHRGPDYSRLRIDRRTDRQQADPTTGNWKVLLCDISQSARLVVMLARHLQGPDRPGDIAVDRHGDWVARERQKWRAAPWADDFVAADVGPEFEENLRTLVGTCRAHRAIPVLVTQPALWGCVDDACEQRFWRRLPDQRRVPHPHLWQELERFNDVTRMVARELQCALVDLAAELPKDNALFYDDDHFTVAGARAVATRIAAAMQRRPEVAARLGN